MLERLSCPVSSCRAENDWQAEVCVRCGVSLREYLRLSAYPAYLFNRGLSAARASHFAQARDLFAAVIHWCPSDLAARNAFAAACLELRDLAEARHQWEEVLSYSSTDPIATQGLATLDRLIAEQEEKTRGQPRRNGKRAATKQFRKKRKRSKKEA